MTLLTPCQDWPGPSFDEKGYGLEGGRRAHIVAWERVHGPVPQQVPRLVLRHRCNRPQCRNVEHLVLGTDKQNAEDRARAGRGANQHGRQTRVRDRRW